MQEPPNRTSLWITLAVALPLLYVLSIGPVVWVVKYRMHRTEAPEWLETFYAPVVALGEFSPAFGRMIEAYGRLWGVDDM